MARVQDPRRVDGGGTHDVKLEQELARWLDASIISADDAEAIRRFESERIEATPTRIPLIAEALGFLGGALAATAGVVSISRFWDDMSTAARLAIVGTVAVLLVVAGRVVRRGDEPALAHLGSFLWALGTGAIAFFTGLVVVERMDWEGADAVFLIGLVTTIAAAALWAWRPAPLQHVVTFGAAAVAIGGIAGQVEHVEGQVIAIALWTFGAVWVVLAGGGLIRPRALAFAIGGALTIAVGRVVAGDQDEVVADVIAVLTAVAMLAASVPAGSLALLWVGVVGVFVSVPITIATHFGDSAGAPIALLIAGLVLIATAIVAARMVPEVKAQRTKPSRFSRRTVTAGLVAVVLAVAALELATIPSFASVPTFPSLRATPDSAISGSVAFLRTGHDVPCVYVTAASGASPERKLVCREDLAGGPGGVTWNDSGNVVVYSYDDRGPRFAEIDPDDGTVVSEGASPNAGKELWADRATRASDGASLIIDEAGRGEPRLRLQTTTGTTTVYAADGPMDYQFRDVTWSPDGTHAIVTDSEDRLIVFTIEGGDPSPRLLSENGTGPAWSSVELP